MKTVIILLSVFCINSQAFSQSNMLGKSLQYIYNKYNIDPEYFVKTDTVNSSTIVVTCRTSVTYPYYTFEIDRNSDECVSYGTVSKDRKVYDTYIELLSLVGKTVDHDPKNENTTFLVRTNTGNNLYFSIKQPFKNSELVSRRNIFYILVTEADQ